MSDSPTGIERPQTYDGYIRTCPRERGCELVLARRLEQERRVRRAGSRALPGLRRGPSRRRALRSRRHMLRVRSARATIGASVDRAAVRPRLLRRAFRGRAYPGPTRIHRLAPVPRAGGRGTRAQRRPRSGRYRYRERRRTPGGRGGLGLPLHRRLDGLRRRRACRGGDGAGAAWRAALRRRHRLRRGAHAGGDGRAAADGEDGGRRPASARGRRAPDHRARRPHHRRGLRLLREPRRRDARRGRGADRLRRAARARRARRR